MENFSRDLETIKENKTDILDLKNTINEIKKSINGVLTLVRMQKVIRDCHSYLNNQNNTDKLQKP